MDRAELHVRIDAKLKERFKAICKKKDFEMGEVIEVFIDRYLNDQMRYNKLVRNYDKKITASRMDESKGRGTREER